ncbi:FAD-dependent oxidoreductase [Nocardia otitidiscaviarum]|uniref:FAD-dependent oxidoreductase n=1 Tax=Nocardia otitidiscaviarum TaxID=1823 RepID=UPI001FD00AD8|nr:FAD-dependent oxidoreductase [Nocardia otitidiscaviarum]MCP9622375.1 FAD-dependent oxidoreductase [Nocardia otitidiscaviarum]
MVRTLAVVGGGVIGLSVAWRAAESGWRVTLYDPAVGSGASWVAGGMLAPLSEGWPGEDAALEFGAASLTRWPDFAARLKSVTGAEVFTAAETLTVALDAADAADLRTIADWVNATLPDLAESGAGSPSPADRAVASPVDQPAATASIASSSHPGGADGAQPILGGEHRGAEAAARGASAGRALQLLDRTEVRSAEPGLDRRVRAGLLSPAEPAVDNRTLVTALREACAVAGVEVRAEEVAALRELPHDRVVLATGASARLWPDLPVRPVKGEILRLRRRPSAPPPPNRVVRARVHGRPIYLVPRPDGLVLGATQYEAGFDTVVTVGGVRDLITDAEAIFPGVGEYEFAEATAGSRPGTPDNLPLIGHLDERVIAALGHGRNGILGVPVTADAVLALLADTELPAARAASPTRFRVPEPHCAGGKQ